MQYSSANTIIPISDILKPGIEEIEPELESEDEQTVKDQEKSDTEKEQAETEGEDEQTVKDEDKPVTKEPITEQPNQTKSEETKSEVPTGKFGSNLVDKNFSTLKEANVTNAPNYTITIKFDSLTPFQRPGSCSFWTIAAYVQGERNELIFPQIQLALKRIPYKFCDENRAIPIPLDKNPPVTVEIPREPVENIHDSMPLSIFTVGYAISEFGECSTYLSTPWPTELPEVKNALADKGSMRPYYAHTMEKITQIQKETNRACTSIGYQYNSPYPINNQLTGTLNVLEGSPTYGKRVPADTVGNPESVKVTTCTHPFLYCLTYTITCPLCLAQRVH